MGVGPRIYHFTAAAPMIDPYPKMAAGRAPRTGGKHAHAHTPPRHRSWLDRWREFELGTLYCHFLKQTF